MSMAVRPWSGLACSLTIPFTLIRDSLSVGHIRGHGVLALRAYPICITTLPSSFLPFLPKHITTSLCPIWCLPPFQKHPPPPRTFPVVNFGFVDFPIIITTTRHCQLGSLSCLSSQPKKKKPLFFFGRDFQQITRHPLTTLQSFQPINNTIPPTSCTAPPPSKQIKFGEFVHPKEENTQTCQRARER